MLNVTQLICLLFSVPQTPTESIVPVLFCFVFADGTLDVFQQNKLLTSITVWTTFGELAILYNCTRTASVRGGTDASWECVRGCLTLDSTFCDKAKCENALAGVSSDHPLS